MNKNMKKKMKKQDFYSIGEVSEILGLKDYIIRFWEKEFEQLSPIISKKGNRRKYGLKDIHIIKRIQSLVHENGYTLSGAKKQLTDEIKNDPYFFQEAKLSSLLDQNEDKNKDKSLSYIVKNDDIKTKFILKSLYEILNLLKEAKQIISKKGDKNL